MEEIKRAERDSVRVGVLPSPFGVPVPQAAGGAKPPGEGDFHQAEDHQPDPQAPRSPLTTASPSSGWIKRHAVAVYAGGGQFDTIIELYPERGLRDGGAMSDEVLVERRGAVQVITINRPEARNALNGAVAAGIRDAADELDADGVLQVGVLTGAGGTFSAGMDLKAFLKGETPPFPAAAVRHHPDPAAQAADRRGRGLGPAARLRAAARLRPGGRGRRPGSVCPRSSAGWWPALAGRCCSRGGYRGRSHWR